MNWKLGNTSRKYEVGNGGPATVSSGSGDYGGVSYRNLSTLIQDGNSS